MYGCYLRRLEKDKVDWYKSHGMKPPNIETGRKELKGKKGDANTYTQTTVMNTYAPSIPEIRKPFSYWEGDGAGVEPMDFRESICALRSTNVVSPHHVHLPKTGRLNDCFTPYENDIMSFDAFETVRKELKHKSEHLAQEIDRVNKEWNRPPKENWFCMKDRAFSIEHSRFMELKRRNTGSNKKFHAKISD